MLEKLARHKHSSLLRKLVNYGGKRFYKIGSRYQKLEKKKRLITLTPGISIRPEDRGSGRGPLRLRGPVPLQRVLGLGLVQQECQI
jgi:hypothetical protein